MVMPLSDLPLHRAIVAVDIEGSTRQTNTGRAHFRTVLFQLLDEAFLAAGIGRKARDPFIDRGDGALCLIRPVDRAPKTVLLAQVIPTLAELLDEHAAEHPALAFRLRVAVHAGEVHYDSRGPYGEDIDITCRLLDALEVKRRLSTGTARLVLVVSHEIYRSVVRHGYPGIDHTAFVPAVTVRIGEQRQRGWIHTEEAAPGEDLSA